MIILKEKSKLAENNLRIFISAVIKVIKPSSFVSGYIESSQLTQKFKAVLNKEPRGISLSFDNIRITITDLSEFGVFENNTRLVAGNIQSVTLTNWDISFWGISTGNREITISIKI